jgi:NADPH:quinone reductase-like Zn-dependent oxidoreductase
VLIHGGSGGVGSYAIQLAVLFGAECWATASAGKLPFLESLGAARAIDYRATPMSRVDGRFHLIVDVASRSSYGECRHLLEPHGIYVTLLPTASFAIGKLSALVSGRACRLVMVKPTRADLDLLAGWMAEGRLKSPIDSRFGLEGVPDALRRLGSGEVQGKICVEIAAAAGPASP